jgi:hypothetical protein
MFKFELLYRAIVDYDEAYNPENDKTVDNFSFFITRIKMLIPILFESMKECQIYFHDNENLINFSVKSKKELFELFEKNTSKIINLVIIQEIGTLNVLALIYKSDNIDAYRQIVQELINDGKIAALFFKKEGIFAATSDPENVCGCEKCECGYIENS